MDVPVDLPSVMTTVDLKISSRSFKAAYLSSASVLVSSGGGLEALEGVVVFLGVITGLNYEKNREIVTI